jgi:DNA-binding NtrC family response regulator
MARILLVEDDIDVRPLMQHILSAAGHDVTAVETVTNALKLIGAQPFDLIITDANLPDGSGLKVADAAAAAGLKALVITGHGLSLQPGSLAAYDYLLKPLRPHELVEAIRKRLAPKDGDADVIPLPKRPT